ncbi:MAG: SHOCT domain-containing protein [Lachnospiraceae bacterium]|nr:SHOCT domain-containing protein [Lachnospiraceae bacterium]
MDNKKRIRYSIQLAMLKQLLNKGMITEEEYRRILVKLKKDYSVVSDVNT